MLTGLSAFQNVTFSPFLTRGMPFAPITPMSARPYVKPCIEMSVTIGPFFFGSGGHLPNLQPPK
jgi:hypothetical protein